MTMEASDQHQKRSARACRNLQALPKAHRWHWFRLMAAPHEQFFWTSRQRRVMLLRRAISLSSGGDYDTDPKALPLL